VEAEVERLGDRAGADALTRTERTIAALVADGMTNAEVAAQLYVSPRTVEAHLTRIYRKEGVRSRSELAARHRTSS
jgi:DNA-binding CsgD family transcriptional regulator